MVKRILTSGILAASALVVPWTLATSAADAATPTTVDQAWGAAAAQTGGAWEKNSWTRGQWSPSDDDPDNGDDMDDRYDRDNGDDMSNGDDG